jgi:hypothetical protein
VKRILRWLVRLVLVVVALALALVAYVYIASGRLMARTYRVDQVPHTLVRSDPERRRHDIADARLEIEDGNLLPESTPVSTP